MLLNIIEIFSINRTLKINRKFGQMLANFFKQTLQVEVVGAQLVKLPTAEVHGSNPVIIKLYIKLYTVNCIEKAKNK